MNASSRLVLGYLSISLLVGCGDTASESVGEPTAGRVAFEGEATPAAAAESAESFDSAIAAQPIATGGAARRRPLGMPGMGTSAEARLGGTGYFETTLPQDSLSTEAYSHVAENGFVAVRSQPLSTFSIDVDTASYSNVRRFLERGNLPPAGAVRIEELVNYFDYDYAPPPGDDVPFAVHVEVAGCSWSAGHRLARIGLKGREIDFAARPPGNLVFLLDVSGSMRQPNKLPLMKEALRLLVDRLGENDRVAIVVYAGTSGLVLPSTTADQRGVLLSAIDRLEAGGSTNGGAGIQLAYDTAIEHFVPGGTNRVILCTDGDFNVGTTSESELVDLIEAKAKSGVFLSVLGFGVGNLKDATMEQLADKGNGNYAYVDTIAEGRKVLVEQLAGTLITIAKDVKIQVDFNPAKVAGYRLIGYENRMLKPEDFKNDAKDAGEIGAGHAVTALYELVPAGRPVPAGDVEPSRYQTPPELTDAASGDDSFTVRLRYKRPDGETSVPLAGAAADGGRTFDEASTDFQFAAAVAQFGLQLRGSEHAGDASWAATREIAAGSLGDDPNGYRAEFLRLIETAATLHGRAEGMASAAPAGRRAR